MNQSLWETNYEQGNELNRYPMDRVVSVIFRTFSGQKDRDKIKILEFGSGCGNNIWFLAREGFQAYGIEWSKTAHNFAVNRMKAENLSPVLVNGNNTQTPWEDNYFDMVIDRASFTHNPEFIHQCINEAYRVLKPKGYFYTQLFSSEHDHKQYGQLYVENGYHKFKEGLFQNVGPTFFLRQEDLTKYFNPEKFEIINCIHVVQNVLCDKDKSSIMHPPKHGSWDILLKKI